MYYSTFLALVSYKNEQERQIGPSTFNLLGKRKTLPSLYTVDTPEGWVACVLVLSTIRRLRDESMPEGQEMHLLFLFQLQLWTHGISILGSCSDPWLFLESEHPRLIRWSALYLKT